MSDEGFHSNWPPGYPWIMFKLPFAILIRMALWPCTGGRSVSLGEALQVNLARWSRSTQTNGSTAVPCCSSGRPCPSVFPVPLGKLTDSKLSSVPCPPPPKSEVSIPTPTPVCKTLRRREGKFQKPAAGHRAGTFAFRPDLAAQMPIPICVCALVTQIARVLGLYSRGKRPGRVGAEVPRQPKVSPLGATCNREGCPSS